MKHSLRATALSNPETKPGPAPPATGQTFAHASRVMSYLRSKPNPDASTAAEKPTATPESAKPAPRPGVSLGEACLLVSGVERSWHTRKKESPASPVVPVTTDPMNVPHIDDPAAIARFDALVALLPQHLFVEPPMGPTEPQAPPEAPETQVE